MASASTYNCVDGTKAYNLTATWNGSDTFTVKSKSGGNFCKDVTLYGSSYILTSPDYKGGLFGAVGTAPQTLYKSVTVTLKQGTNGTVSIDQYHTAPTTVVVPLSPCGNQQVDLYYGPEVTTVTTAGHGSQYIAGNIITPFNTNACVTGGQGGETPTPPAVTPQVEAAATVVPAAQLTDTGLNIWVTSLLAVATMASAIFVSRKKPVSNK